MLHRTPVASRPQGKGFWGSLVVFLLVSGRFSFPPVLILGSMFLWRCFCREQSPCRENEREREREREPCHPEPFIGDFWRPPNFGWRSKSIQRNKPRTCEANVPAQGTSQPSYGARASVPAPGTGVRPGGGTADLPPPGALGLWLLGGCRLPPPRENQY